MRMIVKFGPGAWAKAFGAAVLNLISTTDLLVTIVCKK